MTDRSKDLLSLQVNLGGPEPPRSFGQSILAASKPRRSDDNSEPGSVRGTQSNSRMITSSRGVIVNPSSRGIKSQMVSSRGVRKIVDGPEKEKEMMQIEMEKAEYQAQALDSYFDSLNKKHEEGYIDYEEEYHEEDGMFSDDVFQEDFDNEDIDYLAKESSGVTIYESSVPKQKVEVVKALSQKPAESLHLARANSATDGVKLNEDGEVDVVVSWSSAWHQRILLTINFVFLIVGIGILDCGLYAYRTNIIDFKVAGIFFQAISVVGFFTAILSLLGCWGAYHEKRLVLVAYAVILFLILIAQLVLGVLVYQSRSEAPKYMREIWDAAPNNVRVQIEDSLSCCGLSFFNDSAGLPCPQYIMPVTHVPFFLANTVETVSTTPTPSQLPPCLPIMIDAFTQSSYMISVVVITIAVCQLMSTILVVVLLRRLQTIQEQRQLELDKQS